MQTELLFHAAVDQGLPVVLWRLPGDDKTHVMIELSEKLSGTRVTLGNKAGGFAFSPFVNPGCKETLFLHGDLWFETSFGKIVENPALEGNSEKQKRKRIFFQRVNQLSASPREKAPQWHTPSIQPTLQSEKEHYCDLVAKGIQAIRNKDFKKLVLSRTKVILLPDDFNVTGLFKKLCEEYLKGFVYLISIPKVGTWMGATPEILVSITQDNILHTVALGGTQVMNPETLKHPVWKRKEIEEQAFISRYIANGLKKAGVKEFRQEGPQTIVAGNLLHLKTNFSVNLNTSQPQTLGNSLLELLHPTPAVCGIPKNEAAAYIVKNEGYERQFYTGFLGPIGVNQECHLYVNLRCMQLHQKQAILYVGAGITKESNPEKEWFETEAKCHTLLKVISPTKTSIDPRTQ
jgi:isochorismate synthase